MARTNPEKVEGNSGPCVKCGKTIYCNMTTYKDRDNYLQWQGSDNKAHYTQNGDCKNTAQQVSNTVQAIKTQKIKLEDINLPPEVVEKAMYVIRSAEQFNKLTEYVVYDELGQDANPAQVAYHTKIITNKLLNVPNLQEILENVRGKDE